jgi:ribose 1,5-bisphosphokinase
MGPSGAGKDAVISAVCAKFNKNNDLYFTRRYVTRMDAGADSRDIGLTQEEFEHNWRRGLFALDWRAHGLSYGIRKIINNHLAAGKTVVVNGSRAYLREALSRYPSLLAVQISVPREVARQRLLARGRESAQDIEARLSRSPAFDVPPSWMITIDNSGPLEEAVEAFATLLLNECVSA